MTATVRRQRAPVEWRRLFTVWLAQHAQACVFSAGQMFRNPIGSLLTASVIGISLAYYGLAPRLGPSIGNVVVKLVVQPALVLLSARWLFGLHGLPLSVVVLMGALPVGANALIFAQRYETLEAETATAIVISTLLYCVTLPLWLFVLSALPA